MRAALSTLTFCLLALAAGRAEAKEVDFTAAVLLLSDVPRQLREACPQLADPEADCRVERVTASPGANGWTGEALVRIYRKNGSEDTLTMSARLEPNDCRLVDRKVEPSTPVARRLLTLTEREIALARRNPNGMRSFCLMAGGLLGDAQPPPCLCP